MTEITCHAKGVYRELAHGGTLVDIGGQDSKVIRISPKGDVTDFAMNDKCAAGTGRFLENTAHRLGVPLERMGQVALSAAEEVSISSTCTVFAESEVISLIAHGVAVESILRGLHRSLIKRVVAMIRTVGPRAAADAFGRRRAKRGHRPDAGGRNGRKGPDPAPSAADGRLWRSAACVGVGDSVDPNSVILSAAKNLWFTRRRDPCCRSELALTLNGVKGKG